MFNQKEPIKIKFSDMMTDEVKGDIIFEIMQLYIHMFRPVICFIILFCVLSVNTNVSNSMEPTIYENDISIILKSKKHDFQRGDLVSFASPLENMFYSKRVIGIAGDELRFEDGNVYLNSILLEEDYVRGQTYLDFGFYENSTIKVKEGYYFLMGDNRENSMDSRYFGEVKKEDINGRVIFLIPTHKINKKSRSVYN